jgi:hypothetical protein
MDWKIIISEYVCPSLGCFIASAVFAAPINDLCNALKRGSLGNLNTVPWSIMTGNCLGWCSYAYYTNDPFVLAANLPGLILSFWLNIGAAKLQYLKQIQINDHNNNNNNTIISSSSSSSSSLPDDDDDDENNNDVVEDCTNNNRNKSNDNDNNNNNNTGRIIYQDSDIIPISQQPRKRRRNIINNSTTTTTSSSSSSSSSLTSSSQDVLFLRVISIWSIIIVCVGWIDIFRSSGYEQKIIGILVNINLVFFYGAPLQTMKIVFETKASNSIHTPTVTMNVINAIFWISYGLAKNDIIIYGPNGIGLLLGIAQGILCLIYPSSSSSSSKKRNEEEEVTLELQPLPYRDDQELFTNDRDFVSSTSTSSSPELINHSLDSETIIT